MISAYLIYDMRSLQSCSLIGYSWYIAAAPHLYYKLFVDANSRSQILRLPNSPGPVVCFPWSRLPRSSGRAALFSSKGFNSRILHRFSTLSNVRWLMIDYLDISSIMPRFQRYLATSYRWFKLQELFLRGPKGSHRQITYFIRLFQRLEGRFSRGASGRPDAHSTLRRFELSRSQCHLSIGRSCVERRSIGHRLESPQARAFDVHVSYILQGRGSLSAARLPWCGKLVKSRPAPCTRDSAR